MKREESEGGPERKQKKSCEEQSLKKLNFTEK
jgi:hypothetical protein